MEDRRRLGIARDTSTTRLRRTIEFEIYCYVTNQLKIIRYDQNRSNLLFAVQKLCGDGGYPVLHVWSTSQACLIRKLRPGKGRLGGDSNVFGCLRPDFAETNDPPLRLRIPAPAEYQFSFRNTGILFAAITQNTCVSYAPSPFSTPEVAV